MVLKGKAKLWMPRIYFSQNVCVFFPASVTNDSQWPFTEEDAYILAEIDPEKKIVILSSLNK